MKKTYVVIFCIIAGIAIYSIIAPMFENKGDSTQTAPGTQNSTAPVAAGLNPAHGLPGHRCDIAVGAPLPTANAAADSTQVGGPLKNARLNPAHGMPGHRCDIKVGDPLL